MTDLEVFSPIGGMDSDTDLLYMKEGDYRDAKNIRHVTDSTGSTISIINIKGTDHVFTLPTVTAKNKIYRIKDFTAITTPTPQLNELTFYRSDNSPLITVPFSDGATVIDSMNNLVSAVTFLFITTPFLATATAGADYVDIEIIGAYTGYEYLMVVSQGDTTALVYQEAITSSMAGTMKAIGSYDILGDLMIFSAVENEIESKAADIIGAGPIGSEIQLITSSDHGLTSGDQVFITGVVGVPANGLFLVTVNTTTTFTLSYSVYSGSYVSGGEVFIKTQAVGEIGVAQYNVTTTLFTYTTLLQSKKLNYRIKKQIDCHVEKNAFSVSVYGTDDYNPPFAIYYYGAYMTNGFLEVFNSDKGSYDYDTLDQEIVLQISNTKSKITFLEQLESGGSLTAGNKRYAVRFLTQSNTGTNFGDLTNPINVYSAGKTPTNLIVGDSAGTTTGKANKLLVSDITPGLFSYVELAVVNYDGGAASGVIVSRYPLTPDQTSIEILHTGNETDSTTLSLTELLSFNFQYATAKNIRAIDNRLVLSNLTILQETEFTDWAQTFKHAVLRKEIPTVGVSELGALQTEEYFKPENVNNNVGYMLNETYCFGVKCRLKTGQWTRVFHVDNIKIDTDTTVARRTAALASLDMTTYPTTDKINVYVPYVEFSDINLDFIVGGKRIRDLIDAFSIVRVEMTSQNSTILYNGYVVPNVSSAASSVQNVRFFEDSGSPSVGEWPYPGGDGYLGVDPTYSTGWAVTNGGTYGAFYSSDVLWGHSDFNFANGDKIICFGNPKLQNGFVHTPDVNPLPDVSSFGEYSGNFPTNATVISTGHPWMPPTIKNIDSAIYVPMGGKAAFPDGTGISKGFWSFDAFTSLPLHKSQIIGSPFLKSFDLFEPLGFVNGPIADVQRDYGFYYCQYYRAKTNQFGNLDNAKYIATGHIYEIDVLSPSTIPTGTIGVFGGDTFTQKSYLKIRYCYDDNDPLTVGATPYPGANAVAYYSQNRANIQMRNKSGITASNLYPAMSAATWLLSKISNDGLDERLYNEGYTVRNDVQYTAAFSTRDRFISDFPARIIYSEVKILEGIQDNFRLFLPLNFKDLELSYGEIMHHEIINGELVTVQPRKVQRQYFNTRGTLTTSSDQTILIGSGAVMSQDGVTLTQIGGWNKWACIKGKSAQGNDVLYWINTELKKVMRLGHDGTISLADIRGQQSFFANNLRFVHEVDTPAHGEGICGIWDDRYNEAVWTVRGRKMVADYDITAAYATGDEVFFQPTTYSTFEKTGEIYKAITANAVGSTPATSPATWQIQSHTDADYYNEYTIVFNETKNKFSAFYTFKPKIYLKWRDAYLSPRPADDENFIYLHNIGPYCEFYDHGTNNQAEDGHIEAVIKKAPAEAKYYEALKVVSDIIPYRFDFTTKDHISFLTQAEFEAREDLYYSPVKEDSTGTGINDADTSLLFGTYMKAKMTFEKLVYQSLKSFIVKFRVASRITQK